MVDVFAYCVKYIETQTTKTEHLLCSSFPFIYESTGHAITGDLNIIETTKWRCLLSICSQYGDAQHVSS